MSKILKMTMVQTITINQIMTSREADKFEVGPIKGADLAKLRAEAEADAEKESEPGVSIVISDIRAEVIEI